MKNGYMCLNRNGKITRCMFYCFKLVILDRYTMYAGRFDDIIEKYRDDIIFIIDYKNEQTLNRYAKYCCLEMRWDKLEVTDCDDF